MNDPAPWDKGSLPLVEFAGASWLIFSIFLLPMLIKTTMPSAGTADIALISGLAATAVFFLITPGECAMRKLKLKDFFIALGITAGTLFISGIVTFEWRLLLDKHGITYEPYQRILFDMVHCAPHELVMLIIAICVITPIIEEILFRRLIYGALLRCGTLAAFTITALIFSAVHFFLAGLPGLAILGLGFQLCFYLTGNLNSAVLSHIAVNTTATMIHLFMVNP